jgi:hypothetical protein
MTTKQEDALIEFIEDCVKPFTAEDAAAAVPLNPSQKFKVLAAEITEFITTRNAAFPLEPNKWMSRRGCFEKSGVQFVIKPSRMELTNGVLIPGHRCVPFTNPQLFPYNYTFFWGDDPLSRTEMEGAPEEFYPYYALYGEEYGPQYIARDNSENEAAFSRDPYEDPPCVTLQSLDMRKIYRESGFVPGDYFVVTPCNWKEGWFTLDRVDKNAWSEGEFEEWSRAAEAGFSASFKRLGPGATTEEQIAFAYWYGGERMRSVPAYPLEVFLYEKTNGIETVSYGVESRFWYAGKEIPDLRELEAKPVFPDQTPIEEMLFRKNIPISEFTVNAYIQDGLFRQDAEAARIVERLIPKSVEISDKELGLLTDYIQDVINEMEKRYEYFTDQKAGPIRLRIAELHTAVIDLSAKLRKGNVEPSSLPRHTFIILSQIQNHSAAMLEDLDGEEALAPLELRTLDNSVDSMIDTYQEIKGMIQASLDLFRQNILSVVGGEGENGRAGRLIQISLGGLEVWRRLVVPNSCALEDLHQIIQRAFGWNGRAEFRFFSEFERESRNLPEKTNIRLFSSQSGLKNPGSERDGELPKNRRLADLGPWGHITLSYEYAERWTISVMLLARVDMEPGDPVRCVAGEGAAPPECIEGPVQFKKQLALLKNGGFGDRQRILTELGEWFDPDGFDIAACNRLLKELDLQKR